MSQPPDVGALLQGAHDEGLLSAAGLQALTLLDVGAQIQAGLGIAAMDVQASEVVLVTVMPDDSGSIGMTGKNAQLVRDGHHVALGSSGAIVAGRQAVSVSRTGTEIPVQQVLAAVAGVSVSREKRHVLEAAPPRALAGRIAADFP